MTITGWINTVTGTIPAEDLRLTLPHEHLFTDLRGPVVLDYAQADPDHVVAVMKSYLDEIADLGVNALVECSTIGVGRNPVILKRLAQNTPIRIIAPTGVYREAYVPLDLKDKSANELAEMWVNDILEGIGGSDVKAGFIKMAVSDEGITEIEAKNLKAAVLASQQTGAILASHTIGGELARHEMNLLDSYGLDLNRFIWTHAQSEPDKSFHLEAAQRGAYVSIDAIGSGWAPDPDMLEYTLVLIEAGYTDKILLSHDAGWYDPSQPDGHPEGNGIRGYTALFKSFLPALRAQGVSERTIDQITIKNPSRAFALNVV
jgi:phosphotriesterase-related protein